MIISIHTLFDPGVWAAGCRVPGVTWSLVGVGSGRVGVGGTREKDVSTGKASCRLTWPLTDTWLEGGGDPFPPPPTPLPRGTCGKCIPTHPHSSGLLNSGRFEHHHFKIIFFYKTINVYTYFFMFTLFTFFKYFIE